MRKPKIKVKGNVQDVKKLKRILNQNNLFFLKINTNQQLKEDNPNFKDDIEIFDNSINQCLKCF